MTKKICGLSLFLSESKPLVNDGDLDPEQNFYNDFTIEDSVYTTAIDLKTSYSSDSDLSILHINCRSLNKNFDSILQLIAQFKFTIPIIAVTETWTTKLTEADFPISGYKFIAKSRENKSGGGVGLYVLETISFKERCDLHVDASNVFESIFIELLNVPNKTVIGCVYKPPDSDVSAFNMLIDTALSVINSQKCMCTIAGDFNIDLLKAECHSPTTDFVNCLFSHSFYPVINKPTRITETSATLIDNFLINYNSQFKVVPSILCSDISDHLPILLSVRLNQGIKTTRHQYIYKRLFTEDNKLKFLNKLQADTLNDDTDENASADFLYSSSIDKYTSIFESCFPLRKFHKSDKRLPRKQWMTQGLAKSCHTKEKLYKAFISNPSKSNKDKYGAYRNKLNKILKKAEQAYYRQKFDQLQSNLKQSWQTIKFILNKTNSSPLADEFVIGSKTVNDSALIAQTFNEYFVNIGPTLANKIPDSSVSYMTFLKGNFKDSFTLFETDISEVITVTKNLKSKTSYGYDNIPSDIVKLSITYTAPHLARIINKSFAEGTVPNQLKVAKVCPIYKNGDATKVSNYRPISVLPSISKVFEKLVYNRLINYLTKFSILSNQQYGFRSNLSTSLAILEMVKK
jgi:hypothetical protein